MRPGLVRQVEVNGDPAEMAFAVDLVGCGAGVDERLGALAIALFDHEAAFLDGMGLILNGHAALALFDGQALWDGILGPGAWSLAVQDGAIYGAGHRLAITGQARRAFIRDMGADDGCVDGPRDCARGGRQQNRAGQDVPLAEQSLPEGETHALEDIHWCDMGTSPIQNNR